MGLLQLGTFVFEIDDLPEKIELGGRQIAAIYQYPGGVKDIQVFGALDDPITLAGTFNYNAEYKASVIDKMYRSGGQYTLKVTSFKSIVGIITKFKPTYRSSYAIDYSIEFEPMKNSFVTAPSGSSRGTGSANASSNKVVSTAPKSYKPAPQRVYTVVKGDTLWGISKKYYGSGTVYSKIMTANKLKTTLLHPGQKLVIP